jgi:hypothetical protein
VVESVILAQLKASPQRPRAQNLESNKAGLALLRLNQDPLCDGYLVADIGRLQKRSYESLGSVVFRDWNTTRVDPVKLYAD